MNTGPKGTQAKEKLISCAARLFVEKGYNAVGISDILAAAEMSKGSFYFYFPSKKELALSVADYYIDMLGKLITRMAENKQWNDFIQELYLFIKQSELKGIQYGCPLAILGMEVAFTDQDISARYAQGLQGLKKVFASVLLRSGLTEEDAARLARQGFAIYEGNLLYYRISKDHRIFDTMLDDLQNIVNCKTIQD